MVGVVGSSPIAPTKIPTENKHLAVTSGAFFMGAGLAAGADLAAVPDYSLYLNPTRRRRAPIGVPMTSSPLLRKALSIAP